MQTTVAIILLVIAFTLLWAWRTKKISNDTLNAIAAILTVIAGIAAIVLFIVPGASAPPLSSETSALENGATKPLSDSFNGSASTYDNNIWDCGKDCGNENIFLEDGKLTLQRSNEGLTYIVSRSSWNFNAIASLAGKIMIKSNLNHGELGWLSMHDSNNVFGCGIHGTQPPYIQCDVGPDRKYVTSELPIEYDTWNSIEIRFEQNPNRVKFYINDTLLGEYVPGTNSDALQVNSGIYSPIESLSGQIYIDDILLTLR